MSKKNKKHQPIPATVTVDPAHLAGLNSARRAVIDAGQRHRADLADVARAKLAAMPGGAEALARVEAIRAGNPPGGARELADAMGAAEHVAEKLAEHHNLSVGGVIEGLHHALPFSQEFQKIALDARNMLVANHMTGTNGEPSSGETVNPDAVNPLAAVGVYATSRSGTRWILGGNNTFDAVMAELRADVHCELASGIHAQKLTTHRLTCGRDCIGSMAESAATQRNLHEYYESELKTVAPEYRDSLDRPTPINVGLLFPVAFGSDVVILKFCVEHAVALVDKYQIQVRECGIQESWESTGNYW
ncbi:hypothetical protein SAMN04488583_6371 [Mycobacterium sp. 88mf]|nr:hypothetical protein SAMN04488583_6371 [Mycobacterium sp. 88mf]SFG61438.1 hypothetical protein SAMN04488582_11072 [Mycobacterium sp. 455mf]